jgi:hypothetical protein
MYNINPEFTQSKNNFDEMSELFRETVNMLRHKYNNHFKNLEVVKTDVEKNIIKNKLKQLNNLIQILKDYQECSNNLMEQYYFLYRNEESSYTDLKKKYTKLKKYSKDNGLDISLVEWL